MGEKLRPCPFCGSPAHIVWGAKRTAVYGDRRKEEIEGACVYCETCNVELFSTAKHLIAEMWNRRADDDQLHEYDKALKTMGDLNDGQSEKIAKLRAQLRAQEPRVLTYEETDAIAHQTEETAVYLERKSDKSLYAAIAGDTQGRVPNISWLGEKRNYTSEYGKTWRCWSAKPTDEQREAVPWTE